MERRTLTAAVHPVPNADQEPVRDFITQESRPPKPEPANGERESAARPVSLNPSPRRRRKGGTITPVGLIPVTVRLRPELAGALKRASLERQLEGEPLFTLQ